MDVPAQQDKNARRKQTLTTYTLMVMLAYGITQLATLAAWFLGYSSVKLHEIATVAAAAVCSTLVFWLIIRARTIISTRFATMIFFSQFGIWLVLYTAWFLTLREMRVLAIFCAVMALSFLQANARLSQSIAITCAAALIQIAGSYVAIHHLGQTGSLGREIFNTLCFLPCALFISHMSEKYAQQRAQLRDAKRMAEESRDKLQEETAKAHRLNAELVEAMTTIREISIRDALTGLYNRRHLMEMLDTEKRRADRSGQRFSVAILDIDHFKKVNDTFGHLMGDEVLKTVARVSQETLRGTDFCARFGGEEFVVVLDQTDEAGALVFAERVRRLVEATAFPELSADFHVTASLGIASYRPVEDIASTIARADGALYRAKHAGRNRVERSEPQT